MSLPRRDIVPVDPARKRGRTRSAIQTCGAAASSAAPAFDGWITTSSVVICPGREATWLVISQHNVRALMIRASSPIGHSRNSSLQTLLTPSKSSSTIFRDFEVLSLSLWRPHQITGFVAKNKVFFFSPRSTFGLLFWSFFRWSSQNGQILRSAIRLGEGTTFSI